VRAGHGSGGGAQASSFACCRPRETVSRYPAGHPNVADRALQRWRRRALCQDDRADSSIGLCFAATHHYVVIER